VAILFAHKPSPVDAPFETALYEAADAAGFEWPDVDAKNRVGFLGYFHY